MTDTGQVDLAALLKEVQQILPVPVCGIVSEQIWNFAMMHDGIQNSFLLLSLGL